MGKQPETLFKENVLRRLRELPSSWWVKIQMVAVCGIPDILGCVNGQFVALELKKSAHDRPTTLQEWVLNKIQMAGGYAVEVNPDNFEELFEKLSGIATGLYSVRIAPGDVPPLVDETH